MTREEAIKRLEGGKEARDRWVPNNGSPASKLSEAAGMAIAALREQEEYESLQNSYDQLQASFDQIYLSNQKMGADLRKLLSEQEERSKGCEFCMNGEHLYTYDKYGNLLNLKLCPMCGMNLEVEK